MTTSAMSVHRPKPSRRVVVETHGFTNGQSVRLKNAMLASGNVYLITASLPTNGASPQYRIRNSGEKFERMACEADLELLSPLPHESGDAAIEDLFGGSRMTQPETSLKRSLRTPPCSPPSSLAARASHLRTARVSTSKRCSRAGEGHAAGR